jgi:hypothetical protein
LTASHSGEVTPPTSSGIGGASPNLSVNPNLICDPGGTCGTPQYFENSQTVDNYTAYNRVEYVGSRTAAEVVGCVVGDAALQVAYALAPGATISFVTGPVLWQAACDIGASIAGAIESSLVVPPQMQVNSPTTAKPLVPSGKMTLGGYER